MGTFLTASVVFPGLPLIAKGVLKITEEQTENTNDWGKYNLWRLRQVIKRMQNSKYIELIEEDNIQVVKITEKGKMKLLKYNIDKMKLDESSWDGKWRLVVYDVVKSKRNNSEMFRKAINNLNLLKLQKSVYLTPFKCDNEIEYLRQIYNVGNEVLILKVGSLENEKAYKKYFGV